MYTGSTCKVTEKYPRYLPWYLVVVVLITLAVLKSNTELLVSSSRSDYMTLLPNGILFVTEITKLGPHNTQTIFKSDSTRLDPQNT